MRNIQDPELPNDQADPRRTNDLETQPERQPALGRAPCSAGKFHWFFRDGKMRYGYLPPFIVFKYQLYCNFLSLLNIISFGLIHIQPRQLIVR